ncbi:MAG: serine/threonine protein kinase [Deltaproteobacteria bacterium]|nr:serine/threonine protein kinase [Deltaproteobacteria bacterium]
MVNARRYQIMEPIGQGSFGSVYRARLLAESGFTKDVAVKILRPEVSGRADLTQRLRDEARLLGLLRHRAILQVDGLVRIEAGWAMVMEYIEGVNLMEATADKRLPLPVALEIIAEVASALHAAWAQPGPDGRPLRLIHRDIKPSNLQLTATGSVKLLDFGVARADFQRESSSNLMLVGSFGYMAPERLDSVDGAEGRHLRLGRRALRDGRRRTPGPHQLQHPAAQRAARGGAASGGDGARRPKTRGAAPHLVDVGL